MCIWGGATEGLLLPSPGVDLRKPDIRAERGWVVWGVPGQQTPLVCSMAVLMRGP